MRMWLGKLFSPLLLLALAASLQATAFGGQTKLSARQKLRRAEAVADRLIESFHKSLDFRAVFGEYFVREPELRRRAVRFGGEIKVSDEISDDLMKRVYVSFMTYLHLLAEYKLIQGKHEVPPEVEEAADNSKYFLLENQPGKQLTTPGELEQGVVETDRISALFRTNFTPGAFETPLYRRNIAAERERARVNSHNVPRVERGNQEFGISVKTPVYVVRREFFDYYFIEEANRPRLFFVDILPNFKLF